MTVAPDTRTLPVLEPEGPMTADVVPAANWFVAARSDQLRRAPLARRILGRWVVLYRTANGGPAALEDRCPHKNVALSMGRVAGDRLVCRYHGWEFDRSGQCVNVPCHSPVEKLPRCRIPGYPVVEQDDWIWIWMGMPEEPAAPPPAWPKTPGYGWFELHTLMAAPLDLILENGLDCSHTGFAHEGLFRSAPNACARARIAETARGVRVETREPPAERPQAASRLFGGGGGEVRHVDEIILPHTLRVDYWIGERSHVVTILVATPEDAWTTRVYTRMGVRHGRITALMTRVVHLLTRRIVAQDRAVLENQAACIRRHGGRSFRAVVADQPATWMQRALRLYRDGQYPPAELRTRDVEYKL